MKTIGSFLLILFIALPAFALEVPPLTQRVTDQVGILGESKTQLQQMLRAHETATGQQFALLVIPTLAGDSLEDFSIRVVEKWKLGQAGKDNGLLLLVVTQDRKMRFEVGYGLEGDIPDALAGRIITAVMAPSFRSGKFGEGITEAFKLVIQAGAGEKVEFAAPPAPKRAPQPPTYSNSKGFDEMTWLDWGIGFLMFLVFVFGRSRGGYSRYSSGGGFSSGGGGGGFSGGGGSFGGGGSSGSW